MNDIVLYREQNAGSQGLPVPEARHPVTVRVGVPGDLAFVDALQKKHSKAVGFARTAQLVGNLAKGHVLIAEDISARPIGYCIAVDKYMKREDTGIVYQMNVEPGRQRGLVGATLLRETFDRWPYGVKLCCCWCAQDLEANRFWESMGFVPIAFRTGGRGKTTVKDMEKGKFKGRVQIFWQRRVRRGDVGVGGTAWWYPSQTANGAMGEDRVVLPILPGVHWSEAKPVVLPGEEQAALEREAERKLLASEKREVTKRRKEEGAKKKKEKQKEATLAQTGGLWFAGGVGGGGPDASLADSLSVGVGGEGKGEATKGKKEKKKNRPELVRFARELRDRWQEAVAAQPGVLEDLSKAGGRYEVGRVLEGGERLVLAGAADGSSPDLATSQGGYVLEGEVEEAAGLRLPSRDEEEDGEVIDAEWEEAA